MASVLQGFIDKVQKEYSRYIQPDVLTAQDTNVITGEPADTTGMRYTGLGKDGKLQKKKPAGIVHEGEQVIEADMVRRAGGSKKIRGAVEGMAGENGLPPKEAPIGTPQMKTAPADATQAPPTPPRQPQTSQGGLPGFRRGTGDGVVRRPLRGYATGTDEGTVIDADTSLTEQNTGNKDTSGDFGANVPDIISDTVGELKDVASGQDEGFKKLSDINRMNLAGRQSADVMKQSQTIAQAQKTGGEAESAKAGLRREQGIETAANEAQLFETQVQRQDEAIKELGRLGLSVAGLEESKAGRLSNEEYRDQIQNSTDAKWSKEHDLALSTFAWGKETWGEEFDLEKERFGLDEAKFEEFKDQFDKNHGLAQEQFDLETEKFTEAKRAQLVSEGFSEREIELKEAEYQQNIKIWEDQRDLNWEKFYQHQKEFGMDYALREMTYNFESNKVLADLALASGDTKAAGEFLALAGLDVDGNSSGVAIDFTRLEDAQTREDYDVAMAGVKEALLDMGGTAHTYRDFNDIPEDSPLAKHLEDLYKATTGKTPSGSSFETWAYAQLDGVRLSQDPYHSAIAGMSDETIESIIEGRDLGSDINSFEYGNETGIEAGRRALVAIMAGGGMTVTENGLEYNPSSPVWNIWRAPSDTYFTSDEIKGMNDIKGTVDDSSVTIDTLMETFWHTPASDGDDQQAPTEALSRVIYDGTVYRTGDQINLNGSIYELSANPDKPFVLKGKVSGSSSDGRDSDTGLIMDKDTDEGKMNIRIFGEDGKSPPDFEDLQPDDWANMSPEGKELFYASDTFLARDERTFKNLGAGGLERSNTPGGDTHRENTWVEPGKTIEINGMIYKIADPAWVHEKEREGDNHDRHKVAFIDPTTDSVVYFDEFTTSWYDVW